MGSVSGRQGGCNDVGQRSTSKDQRRERSVGETGVWRGEKPKRRPKEESAVSLLKPAVVFAIFKLNGLSG